MIGFLVVIGLIALISAAICDIKKREVPNYIGFSLIAIGLAYRAFYSVVESNINFFLFGLYGLLIFITLGYVFYYARLFAGGDAKLLMSLGVILPFSANFKTNMYIFTGFFALFLIVGALYGVIFGVVLSLRNKKRFADEFKKQFKLKNRFVYVALIFAVFMGMISIVFDFFIFLALAILIFLAPLLFIYAKAIEEACMIKAVKVNQLTEGDWLYENIAIGKKTIKPHWEGLKASDIQLIRKNAKNKKILIKQGIPFVPVFLIAFILLILGYSNWEFWKFFYFFNF